MRFHHFALFLVLSIVLNAQQSPVVATPEEQQIAGSILVGGHTFSTLDQLTGQFGPRLTGSSNYERAAQWAAAQFKSYGVDSVRLEPFTLKHGWSRGTATAAIFSPSVYGEATHSVHVVARGWSSNTAPGGVEAEVVTLKAITPEYLKQNAEKIRGKIALLGPGAAGRSNKELIDAEQLSDNLKSVGAVALLEPARQPNDVLATGDPAWHGDILGTPVVGLGHEDAELLKRLLASGPVRMRVDVQNTITGPVQVPNIVAEIRGSSKPDEWVLLGAHFDSWDLANGAQDNGSGSAQVMEAARAIAALKKRPARSMRFALWGGEEEGLLGSFAYVEQHSAELAKCAAVLNTDSGAGQPKGWNAEGRNDVAAALKPLSEGLLRGLAGSEITNESDFETDHGPFLIQGIPALNMSVDMSKYGEVHHTLADTIDKVNAHSLDTGAAILAVTGYAMADAAQPIAPHVDQNAVRELLKKDDLGIYLKAQGLWSGE